MSNPGHPSTTARNLAAGARRRFRKKVVDKHTDPEYRQLRSLRAAYRGGDGPEVLIFGDSAMFFTTSLDTRRRHLADIIREQLPGQPRYEALVGPGYNGRIVGAFLTALHRARSRPKLVVVPTSVLTCMPLFLEHPQFAYRLESDAIRQAVQSGQAPLRGLPRPGPEAFEEYDRLPAPSLFGARRTAGEIRLMISAAPQTNWQRAIRMRHLMDYYNAAALTEDSPGIELVGDVARQLDALELPSVAYIAPVNHEVLRTTLGEGAVDHLRRNAALIEKTYREAAAGSGHVANAALSCPNEEFVDPVHLTYAGRVRLAREISQVAAPLLAR